MTRENLSLAWESTKEKTSNVVTTVRDPAFQSGVKEGFTSFFSKVKSASQRFVGYLTEEDAGVPEQPKQEDPKQHEELNWDDEQEEVKKD